MQIINNLLHFIEHQLLTWSVRLANLKAKALLVNRNLIGLYACEYADGLTRESYIEAAKKMVVYLGKHLRQLGTNMGHHVVAIFIDDIFELGKLKKKEMPMPDVLPDEHCLSPYRCWYYDFCHKQ